jgi:hypothetical protein
VLARKFSIESWAIREVSVVKMDSAVVGEARENRGTIRDDHVGMTKFSIREDDGYQKIMDATEISNSLEEQPS